MFIKSRFKSLQFEDRNKKFKLNKKENNDDVWEVWDSHDLVFQTNAVI